MPYAPWNAGGYYPFTYGTGGGTPNTTSYGTNAQPSGGGGTVGGGYGSLPSYTVNPGPQQGNGAYGLVPGPTGIPPSTYQQTVSALPGLGTAGTQATNSILSQLQGDISPQALRNMQDAAAQFGVSSGMPGSNAVPGSLAFNKNLLGNYRTTEQLQQQGLQNYANVLGAVGQQQIPPALAAEIAAHNAQLGAAPNPQSAAEQQLANYFAALNATRSQGLRGAPNYGGGFDPAGGTGRYAPQGPSALGFGFGQYGQQGGGQAGYQASPYGPVPSGTGFSPDMLYPGTELTGQPNLSSLLGPVNQSYAPSGGYFDPGAATSNYWDFSNDFGLQPVDYGQDYYNDLGG